MSYGTTPVGSDAVPLSSALVPGNTNMVPVGGTTIFTDSNSNNYTLIAVEDLEPANYVSASSPPSATNAGSDTTYTFSSQVNHVIMQNGTSAVVNFAFDTAASAGSLALQPGVIMVYAKKVTAVHLYTAAAQNINGTSAGNIVLLGAL